MAHQRFLFGHQLLQKRWISASSPQRDSTTVCTLHHPNSPPPRNKLPARPKLFQRKAKGQQLKDKIVSALFHIFWYLSALFHTFSKFFFFFFFSKFFLKDFFSEIRGFTTVLVRRDEKRIKENKKKNTKPFCTLVRAEKRLSKRVFLESPFLLCPLKVCY